MPDPTDFTPDKPFFRAVARLRQEVVAGVRNQHMAAGQLVADGYPITFEHARTLIATPVVESASAAADVVGRWIEVDLFAMAAKLSLDLQQTVSPLKFAGVALDCASGFETGALDAQRVASRLARECGLPADAAFETMVDLNRMYRAQLFSPHGMRTICSTLDRTASRASSGLGRS